MMIRKWLRILHRDLGYFMAGVVIIYAVSGLAVNHIDDWNPDYVIERSTVFLDLPPDPEKCTRERVLTCLKDITRGGDYHGHDFPSRKRIKIYLAHGSIMARLGEKEGQLETIRRRPVFFESNRLHLSPKGWWLAFADLFAVSLIFITVSGLVLLRGRAGLAGRGKWLVGAGFLIPLLCMLRI